MLATFKMTGIKIDAAPVLRREKTGREKALTKIGKFLHRRMRSSMKRRKKPSKPGSPPSAHTGILKEWILSAIDPRTNSVVIGPKKTNQIFFNGNRQPVKGTVPETLDKGGDIRVLEVFQYGKWVRADLRSKRRLANLPTRLRKVTIAARPFTRPAIAEVLSNKKLEQAFKDIM